MENATVARVKCWSFFFVFNRWCAATELSFSRWSWSQTVRGPRELVLETREWPLLHGHILKKSFLLLNVIGDLQGLRVIPRSEVSQIIARTAAMVEGMKKERRGAVAPLTS